MKYILTDKMILFRGRELRRIKHIDGAFGGYIESERNLSQEGGCWIHPNGKVFDSANVVDNAQVFGIVCGNATIAGLTRIGPKANVKAGYHFHVEII